MCPRPVIVGKVVGQNPLKVPLVQDDDMVEALDALLALDPLTSLDEIVAPRVRKRART